MSRLAGVLPQGMAARFALLLVAALVAANLAAIALIGAERTRLDRAARADREVARIASLLPALEAAAPQDRRMLARQASHRGTRVVVGPRPGLETTADTARSRALEAALRAVLGDRDLRAAVFDGRDGRDGPSRGMAGGPAGGIMVSVRLAVPSGGPPQWLTVIARPDRRPPPGVQEELFLLLLGLSLLSVLAVALVFVRRLTRPLDALARAARAAGDGDRTARVPETGAREMREAAHAFNAMQGRIACFDAERMRTLAAVGHDLRTPITGLRIRAEMLEPEDGAPMIRLLHDMTVMADGLVAFARGAGDAEDAAPLALVDWLGALCEARGASLTVEAPSTVNARPVALGRAVGNLIDNALRYGGAARVRLSADGPQARIVVEDDGPGIPEHRISEMMEPFVRGDASRSTETGGAGLGLSIARAVAQSHGGSVTLENRPEGGMRAVLVLPRAV